MKLIPDLAYRCAAVGSMVLCIAFSGVGLVQSLRKVPELVGAGVPVLSWMADAGATTACFIGLPMYRWSAATFNRILGAMPASLHHLVALAA
jgi:hypothetical protein